MNQSIRLMDQLQLVTSADTQDQLILALTESAYILGFEYFAFGLQAPFPLPSPKIQMVNNYPINWQKKYIDNNYLSVDPIVNHGKLSNAPIIWDEKAFSDAMPFWEDARSFGVQYGWAQASRTPIGEIGMLTLSRSEDKLTEKELCSIQPFLSWLAQLSFSGFSKYLTLDLEIPKLTQREIEILRWTGEGKTSWEVSVILKVSERTVNFHANNAVRKLNVSNKTAAVVRAVILGLI